MQFNQVNNDVMYIEYKGERLEWAISAFKRTRMSKIDDVFRDLNGYLAKLSEDKLDRLWSIYSKINEWFRNGDVDTADYSTTRLKQAVNELYDVIDLNDIDHYIKFHGTVSYPNNLKEVYGPEDTNKDRTYLKHDYHGLVVLTCALRAMLPIWAEYIKIAENQCNNLFKEYVSMRLITESRVMVSEPMQRLIRYIDGTLNPPDRKPQELSNSATLFSMATTEIPDWLLAMVVIRRLAIGEIDADQEKGSLISNIHRFLTQQLDDIENAHGPLKSKFPERDESGDEQSKTEEYKVKQQVTAGDLAAICVYVENPYTFVYHIDPSVPLDIIDACYAQVDSICNQKIVPCQITVCQWMVARNIAPQALPSLNKRAVAQIMAGVQAVMIHWGFTELALMICGEWETSSVYSQTGHNRMSPKLIAEFNEMYPYVSADVSANRSANPAYVAIQAVAKLFSTGTWRVNFLPVMDKEVAKLLHKQSKLAPPPNVAEMLVKLIIRFVKGATPNETNLTNDD